MNNNKSGMKEGSERIKTYAICYVKVLFFQFLWQGMAKIKYDAL